LVERLEVERLLVKLMRKCKYNVKMNLQEVGWRGVEWMCLARDKNR
jgi:hypothetical protein